MKKAGWVGVVFFYLFVFYGAYTGRANGWFAFLNLIPLGDKLGHIFLIGVTGLFVSWLTCYRTVNIKRITLYLGVLMTAVFITAEELLQVFSDYRTCDVTDMFCNWTGAGIAQLFLMYRFNNGNEVSDKTS